MRRKLLSFLEAHYQILRAVNMTLIISNLALNWLVSSWGKNGLSLGVASVTLILHFMFSDFDTELAHAKASAKSWTYVVNPISITKPLLFYIGAVMLVLALMFSDTSPDVGLGVILIGLLTILIGGSMLWRDWLRRNLVVLYPPEVRLEVSYHVHHSSRGKFSILAEKNPYGQATPMAAVDAAVAYYCTNIAQFMERDRVDLARTMAKLMPQLFDLYDDLEVVSDDLPFLK